MLLLVRLLVRSVCGEVCDEEDVVVSVVLDDDDVVVVDDDGGVGGGIGVVVVVLPIIVRHFTLLTLRALSPITLLPTPDLSTSENNYSHNYSRHFLHYYYYYHNSTTTTPINPHDSSTESSFDGDNYTPSR